MNRFLSHGQYQYHFVHLRPSLTLRDPTMGEFQDPTDGATNNVPFFWPYELWGNFP